MDFSVLPGELPYLSTGEGNIVPEGAMLFVPERAYEDDVVEHFEMMALIGVPGSDWLQFSGEDFFPSGTYPSGAEFMNRDLTATLRQPFNRWASMCKSIRNGGSFQLLFQPQDTDAFLPVIKHHCLSRVGMKTGSPRSSTLRLKAATSSSSRLCNRLLMSFH